MMTNGGTLAGVAEERDTTARVFGMLATQLTTALGRARQALAAHAAVLADGALGDFDALLAEFARRRIRIAIYGEVKAGKSTLLNALAGAALSPVAFDPVTALPVRVTYGEETAWHIDGQRLDGLAELERLMRAGPGDVGDDVSEVVVETDLDLLDLGGQVDLLDTPGVGSAAALDAVSAAALRSLDAVILVVRYPALFTQFTRRLMDSLEADIGKLFVVWNLDAACAELTAEERARQTEKLRASVAGAHELFLVDARAGYHALQEEDGAGSVASGLTALIAALRRFAGSDKRQIAALREAAKRSRRQLQDAERRLTQRHGALRGLLDAARRRLQEVQARADAESAAARERHAECVAAVHQIGVAAGARVERLAAEYRRQLRRARRQWAPRGERAVLEAAVEAATGRYVEAVAAASRATAEALQATAGNYGAAAAVSARPRTAPPVGDLAPEDRWVRARSGRAQWLRRAVWRRWYLPGLAALHGAGAAADVQAHAAWLQAATQAVDTAAAATLAGRLAAIAERAAAEGAQIKEETRYADNEAEFGQLERDLPAITTETAAVTEIAAAGRALL